MLAQSDSLLFSTELNFYQVFIMEISRDGEVKWKNRTE